LIRFSLKCSQDHSFESWFQSSEAYENLAAAGMLSCIDCGDSRIVKSLMTPKLSSIKTKSETSLTAPKSDKEKALAKLKAEIEKNSDYVGMNFVSEARAMHDGEQPTRSIYGEARPEEAKALIEDGIRVAPLPFMPKRQTN
jgi:hypothetical protein|tara:strand:- start:236 stop:658 length:423 start_codon:yes stop_codon:yes gene_type:complete